MREVMMTNNTEVNGTNKRGLVLAIQSMNGNSLKTIVNVSCPTEKPMVVHANQTGSIVRAKQCKSDGRQESVIIVSQVYASLLTTQGQGVTLQRYGGKDTWCQSNHKSHLKTSECVSRRIGGVFYSLLQTTTTLRRCEGSCDNLLISLQNLRSILHLIVSVEPQTVF